MSKFTEFIKNLSMRFQFTHCIIYLTFNFNNFRMQ